MKIFDGPNDDIQFDFVGRVVALGVAVFFQKETNKILETNVCELLFKHCPDGDAAVVCLQN